MNGATGEVLDVIQDNDPDSPPEPGPQGQRTGPDPICDEAAACPSRNAV